MRSYVGLALATVLTTASAPLGAQDLIGFDRASYGKVVLSRNQSAGTSAGDRELEMAVGDYNNESIQNYSPDSIFAIMGHSVGRLDILTDTGIFPCTAFIVDKKYILTNYHCVPGILDNEQAKATRIDGVQFVAGYVQQGVDEGTTVFTVIPTPVEADKDLDYSILEVIGDPSAKYGLLALTTRVPHDNDPFLLIGHPMGEAQRISREKCKANRPAMSGNELLHTCDTLPGNSGSPVIDASSFKVIGLHHAGSKKDSVNFAIPMSLIVAKSKYLTAAAAAPGTSLVPDSPLSAPTPGSSGQVEAGKDICDSLYAEAKTYAACFAYRAYADRCGTHPYVGFAKGYIEDNCSAQKNPTPPLPPLNTAGSPPYTPPTNTPVNTPPVTVNPPPQGPLRPWCTSSRLNSTERTICGDAYLASLDKDLGRIYLQKKTSSLAREQGEWLRNSRDPCGSNSSCISQAYSQRIAYLNAYSSSSSSSGSSASLTLPNSQCYIVVASRTSLDEARQFIRERLSVRDGVRVFLSDNGYYGIAVATVSRSESDYLLTQWKSQNRIPSDSYCSSGNRYVQEIAWQSGSSAPEVSSGAVLYVDNNNDGGLNLRSGPGTNYPIIYEMAVGLQLSELARQGSWSQLLLPDGQRGWASSSYLTAYAPRVKVCNGQVRGLDPVAYYNTSTGAGFLSVRSEPSTNTGQRISELYQGDSVRVVAQRDGWARVQCVSGQCQSPYRGDPNAIGWASQKYLSIQCY